MLDHQKQRPLLQLALRATSWISTALQPNQPQAVYLACSWLASRRRHASSADLPSQISVCRAPTSFPKKNVIPDLENAALFIQLKIGGLRIAYAACGNRSSLLASGHRPGCPFLLSIRRLSADWLPRTMRFRQDV